jgi:hypothetical protein
MPTPTVLLSLLQAARDRRAERVALGLGPLRRVLLKLVVPRLKLSVPRLRLVVRRLKSVVRHFRLVVRHLRLVERYLRLRL